MDKQNEALRLAARPVNLRTSRWHREAELELRRLGAAEVDSQRAIKTLQQAGYTDCGGELWKPPLGNAQDFGLEMPEPVGYQWMRTGHYRKSLPADAEKYCWEPLHTADQMRETVAAAVLREREACAKVSERLWPDKDCSGHEWSDGWADGTCASADAIRNRSKA